MKQQRRDHSFLTALRNELVPALGCTEPIAIAYAAAKARSVLGLMPDRMELCCSGNIIKNVKGVVVPNSNGMRGVEVAAILGVVGGRADQELEVLEGITLEHIERAKKLLDRNYCTCTLQKGVANLYIVARVFAGERSASVTIVNRHTLITDIICDGKTLYHSDPTEASSQLDWSCWSVRDIIDFADHVDLADISEVLDRQIQMNSAISDVGLSQKYGAQVGVTLLEHDGSDVKTRAKARAAAGSDARMGGCSLPVVINSGSGNQGVTVSLPVIEYAKELGVSQEKLYRALLVSNLMAIYQKHYIGSLSAFCGAVTAGCAAGAAITYLHGGSYEQICNTIVNTLGNVGGIVCDGAKSSCAAKIASSIDAAILAHDMSMAGRAFQPGEGIVLDDIDHTVMSVGYVGRVGMAETDLEILSLMLNKVKL